jgi:uncharacterized protein (DUF302 family)
MSYSFNKTLDMPFETAIAHVTEALKSKGFGVLSVINIKDTLKAKIGVDFRPYVILGACNPKFAYQALQAEGRIGTMLPCNVVIQELEDGTVEVSAIDPVASMQAVKNSALGGLAGEVQGLLEDMVAGL